MPVPASADLPSWAFERMNSSASIMSTGSLLRSSACVRVSSAVRWAPAARLLRAGAWPRDGGTARRRGRVDIEPGVTAPAACSRHVLRGSERRRPQHNSDRLRARRRGLHRTGAALLATTPRGSALLLRQVGHRRTQLLAAVVRRAGRRSGAPLSLVEVLLLLRHLPILLLVVGTLMCHPQRLSPSPAMTGAVHAAGRRGTADRHGPAPLGPLLGTSCPLGSHQR